MMVNSFKDERLKRLKGLQILFAILLLISFFMPWVKWDDYSLSGYALPAGNFFKTAVQARGPDNPFPQLNFGFYIFWLVPVLATVAVLLSVIKKKASLASFIGGTLALSLVTVYILFTRTLMDLGIGHTLVAMLRPGIYLQMIAAIGLIFSAFPVKNFGVKLAWLLAGPVIAYTGYSVGEHYVMNETFVATQNVKADYTVNAADLLKEFVGSDTATNKKYLEKTLQVNGEVSAVNLLADSTSTIQFTDSTGSYIIFSLEKNELSQAQKIKAGDVISLKGVCSGSIFSEILGTTSVTFKRATLK